jgi:hypothetical protein
LGVTGSFLVIGSYWKFSGNWELLEVVWSLGVTGSYLVMESYWKLFGHGASNSQLPENFQ